MSRFIIEKELTKPSKVREELPVSQELREKIDEGRQEIREILEGTDNRKILIIGPCSAWPDTAVIRYAIKLSELGEKVKDKIKLILRVYTSKPRTTVGWTGSINQPDPFKEPNLEEGIRYSRKMMIDIASMNLPIADEAVFTHNEGYFNELLSYVAIGARSAEDQEHRVFASMIEHPVGLKNPTSGNTTIGVNSVIAAQNPHVFALHGNQVRTEGNPHAHLIMRGGKRFVNYDKEHLQKAATKMKEKSVVNPSIIVDASHDNCVDPNTGKKDPSRQIIIVQDVLKSLKENEELRSIVKGFMVESYLKAGAQKVNGNKDDIDLDGLSVTDPCIGWEETEKLVLGLHKEL